MLVLIPAYQPDQRLIALVRALHDHLEGPRVLVVDDGSGTAYDTVFEGARDAGATVLREPVNRGKGAALKVGFAWIETNAGDEDVVCADCDGQHTPADITAVSSRVAADTIVLGGRRFTGQVPLRSRFGNAVSRHLFRLVTGVAVHDTQSGLRAFPPGLLPWLGGVPGDRFEYEFNQLLDAARRGIRVLEVPIDTIYLDENASSHFRPLHDSARIYWPLLRHALRLAPRG